jgi:hypothetical protein
MRPLLVATVVFLAGVAELAFAAGPVPIILPAGTSRTGDGFYVNVESGAFSTDYVPNASQSFLLTVPQHVGKTDLGACTFKAFDADGHCTLRGSLAPRKDRSSATEACFDISAEPNQAKHIELSFFYADQSGVVRAYEFPLGGHLPSAK